MEILIDFDKSILEEPAFGNNTAAPDMEFDEFLDGVVISRGLVYALRQLESIHIGYRFYTRSRDINTDSFLYRSAMARIFRFMPKGCKHFGGFVNHIPEDVDVFVSSDKKLMYKVLEDRGVVYLGDYESSMKRRRNLYQADSFSQLPMLLSEMRLMTA